MEEDLKTAVKSLPPLELSLVEGIHPESTFVRSGDSFKVLIDGKSLAIDTQKREIYYSNNEERGIADNIARCFGRYVLGDEYKVINRQP